MDANESLAFFADVPPEVISKVLQPPQQSPSSNMELIPLGNGVRANHDNIIPMLGDWWGRMNKVFGRKQKVDLTMWHYNEMMTFLLTQLTKGRQDTLRLEQAKNSIIELKKEKAEKGKSDKTVIAFNKLWAELTRIQDPNKIVERTTKNMDDLVGSIEIVVTFYRLIAARFPILDDNEISVGYKAAYILRMCDNVINDGCKKELELLKVEKESYEAKAILFDYIWGFLKRILGITDIREFDISKPNIDKVGKRIAFRVHCYVLIKEKLPEWKDYETPEEKSEYILALKTRYEQASFDLNAVTKARDLLLNESHSIALEKSKLQGKLNDANQNVGDWEKKYNNTNNTLNNVKSSLKAEREKNVKLEQQTESLTKELEKCKKEMKAEGERADEELAKGRRVYERAKEIYEEDRNLWQDARNKLVQAEKDKCAKLEVDWLEAHEKLANEEKEKRDQLEVALENARALSEKKENDISRLTNELQNENMTQINMVNTFGKEKDTLKKEIEVLSAGLEKQLSLVTEGKKKRKILRKEKAKIQDELKEYIKSAGDKQTREKEHLDKLIEGHTVNEKELGERIDALHKELKESRKETETQEKLVTEEMQKNAHMKIDIDQCTRVYKKAIADLESVTSIKNELRAQLDRPIKEHEYVILLDTFIEKRDKLLDENKETIQNLNDTIRNLNEKIEGLNNQLGESQEKIETHEKLVRDLKDDHYKALEDLYEKNTLALRDLETQKKLVLQAREISTQLNEQLEKKKALIQRKDTDRVELVRMINVAVALFKKEKEIRQKLSSDLKDETKALETLENVLERSKLQTKEEEERVFLEKERSDKLKEYMENVDKSVDSKGNSNEELILKVKRATETIHNLNTENVDAKKTIEEKQQLIERYQKHIETLKANKEKLTLEIEDLRKTTIKELEMEKEELQKHINQQLTEIASKEDAHKTTVALLKINFQECENQKDSDEKQIKALYDELYRVDFDLNETREKLQWAIEAGHVMNEKIEELTSENNVLNSQVKSMATQIVNLQQSKSDADLTIDAYWKTMGELREQIVELKRKKNALKQESHDLKDITIPKLEKEIEALKKQQTQQTNDTDGAKEELKNEITRLNALLETYFAQQDEDQLEKIEHEAHIKRLRREVKEIQEHLEESIKETKKANNKLNDSEKEKEALFLQKERLDVLLDALSKTPTPTEPITSEHVEFPPIYHQTLKNVTNKETKKGEWVYENVKYTKENLRPVLTDRTIVVTQDSAMENDILAITDKLNKAEKDLNDELENNNTIATAMKEKESEYKRLLGESQSIHNNERIELVDEIGKLKEETDRLRQEAASTGETIVKGDTNQYDELRSGLIKTLKMDGSVAMNGQQLTSTKFMKKREITNKDIIEKAGKLVRFQEDIYGRKIYKFQEWSTTDPNARPLKETNDTIGRKKTTLASFVFIPLMPTNTSLIKFLKTKVNESKTIQVVKEKLDDKTDDQGDKIIDKSLKKSSSSSSFYGTMSFGLSGQDIIDKSMILKHNALNSVIPKYAITLRFFTSTLLITTIVINRVKVQMIDNQPRCVIDFNALPKGSYELNHMTNLRHIYRHGEIEIDVMSLHTSRKATIYATYILNDVYGDEYDSFTKTSLLDRNQQSVIDIYHTNKRETVKMELMLIREDWD
jgi:chromosome segregation ATPase